MQKLPAHWKDSLDYQETPETRRKRILAIKQYHGLTAGALPGEPEIEADFRLREAQLWYTKAESLHLVCCLRGGMSFSEIAQTLSKMYLKPYTIGAVAGRTRKLRGLKVRPE